MSHKLPDDVRAAGLGTTPVKALLKSECPELMRYRGCVQSGQLVIFIRSLGFNPGWSFDELSELEEVIEAQ